MLVTLFLVWHQWYTRSTCKRSLFLATLQQIEPRQSEIATGCWCVALRLRCSSCWICTHICWPGGGWTKFWEFVWYSGISKGTVVWVVLACRLAGGTDQVIIHAYLGGEGSSTSWELSGRYPSTVGNFIQCRGPSRAGGREHLQHIGLVGVRARRWSAAIKVSPADWDAQSEIWKCSQKAWCTFQQDKGQEAQEFQRQA